MADAPVDVNKIAAAILTVGMLSQRSDHSSDDYLHEYKRILEALRIKPQSSMNISDAAVENSRRGIER